MNEIRVTDDEMIALSAIAGSAWLPALPSIDVANGEEVAAAYLRGVRALNVRRLVDNDGSANPKIGDPMLSRVLAFLTSAEERIVVSIASTASIPTLEGESYVALLNGASADEALISHITPAGIHEFDETPPATAIDALMSYTRKGFDGGVKAGGEEMREDRCLVVSVTRPDSQAGARVLLGHAELWRTDQDGSARSETTEWRGVQTWLGVEGSASES